MSKCLIFCQEREVKTCRGKKLYDPASKIPHEQMDRMSLQRKLTMDGKAMLADTSKSAAHHWVYLYNMARKSTCIAILAGLSAYLSFHLGVLINLNGNDIVAVAVVYPLVFSLNAAYQRRQEALKSLASFKGHAFALRLCSFHWSKEDRTQQSYRSLLMASCKSCLQT